MKQALHFAFGLIVACSLVACNGEKIKGNGEISSQTRPVPAFTKIAIKGPFTLVAQRNWPRAVAVTSDANLQPYIKTMVENGTLEIYTQKGYNLQPTGPIMVQVSTRKLQQIAAEGKCIVNASDLNADVFEFDVRGGCQANLAGHVDAAKFNVDGAIRIDAKTLLSKQTELDIKGAAQASVYATQKLDVKISGAGQVTYYGKPPVINQAIFGSGELIKGV